MVVVQFRKDKPEEEREEQVPTNSEKGLILASPEVPKGTPSLHAGEIRLSTGFITDVRAAERFRILRARIERRNLAGDRYHLLAVTSAVPAEGKSLISVNLARAFGMDPVGKTLLIDCDLRRPTVHQFFSLKQGPGLSDALVGACPLARTIQTVEPGLDVIPAGNPVNDPNRAIEQPQLIEYFHDLRQFYRFIILDCPPVLLCPEPITLASLADAALMVIRAWRTEKDLIREAINVVGRDALMGVIVNDATEPVSQYGYYRYYGQEKGFGGLRAYADEPDPRTPAKTPYRFFAKKPQQSAK